MNMDDINKHVKGIINDQNNFPLDDFDGLSPAQMDRLLYHTFEEGSVINFAPKAINGIFEGCPAFLVARDLLTLLSGKDGIKLTSKGHLPLRIVKSIYNRDYLPDELIDDGDIELRNEDDWPLLFAVKLMLMLAGLADKKGNLLFLTEKGSELLAEESDYDIYLELIQAFCLSLRWDSMDGYNSEQIGQLGFMYMLYLLKKYGGSFRKPEFYGEKYFRAFPMLYVEEEDWEDEEDDEDVSDEEDSDQEELPYEGYVPPPPYVPDPEEERMECFKLRFFERLCQWFGLAELNMDIIIPESDFVFETFEKIGEVKKSKLFERIIV